MVQELNNINTIYSKKITVIIPAKNEEHNLPSCINAIKKTSNFFFINEIIVVNNNSTDNTVQVAKELGCIVVENLKNSPAVSRNKGAEIARSDFIAFIDADCIISENWCQLLLENFQGKKVVAVGTKVVPDFSNSTWVEKATFLMNNRRGQIVSGHSMKVNWLGTSNLLIKTEIFKKIEGFNEELITAEDYDLCERLRKCGDIILDHRIETIHLRESKTLRELFQREFWRGQNSFTHWMSKKFPLYEAPSVLVPFGFFSLILLGFGIACFDFWLGLVILLVNLVGVFGIVAFKSRARLSLIVSFKCVIVQAVYLLARGVSLIREILLILKLR